MKVTFVVAVRSKGEILANNFMASPCFSEKHEFEILIQENYACAGKAFNDAMDRSSNDLMIFAHQDIVFPKDWPSDFERALKSLEATDPNWGILGCYGETLDHKGRGFVFSTGCGVLGAPFAEPMPVQTLDEIVLIVRKSSGIRFDESLPHFHFYGADVCLEAARRGMKSYAISAFCIHNADQNLILAKEFYAAYKPFKKKWREHLPIHTTSVWVTRWNMTMYMRRLDELQLFIRGKRFGGTRLKDKKQILAMLDGAGSQG
jgi:hypothetical protein